MAVYVDQAGIEWRGKKRHHMAADTVAELHDFAEQLGINRCWFHRGARHPHYDVTDQQRDMAISAGALAVNSRALLAAAKQSQEA